MILETDRRALFDIPDYLECVDSRIMENQRYILLECVSILFYFSTHNLTVLKTCCKIIRTRRRSDVNAKKNRNFQSDCKRIVETAEPVGSKLLIDKYNFNYSSATIRNEMSDLEKLGLIEKTHTSSGRVPSSKGYRFYVEHFLEDQSVRCGNVIAQIFEDRKLGVEEAIRQSVDVLTQMTSLTSMVLGPASSDDALKSVQLIPINDRSAMVVFVTVTGHAEHRIFDFETSVSIEEMESCTNILNERLTGTPLIQVVDKMENLRPILSQRLLQYEVLFEAFVSAFMKFAQEEVYLSGRDNMLYQPEFANIENSDNLHTCLKTPKFERDEYTS